MRKNIISKGDVYYEKAITARENNRFYPYPMFGSTTNVYVDIC